VIASERSTVGRALVTVTKIVTPLPSLAVAAVAEGRFRYHGRAGKAGLPLTVAMNPRRQLYVVKLQTSRRHARTPCMSLAVKPVVDPVQYRQTCVRFDYASGRCIHRHDTRALNTYLDDGWDPFAVTDGNGVETVWLRRRSSDCERAEAVQPSGPRLEDEVRQR
jgi:hypothetical protein